LHQEWSSSYACTKLVQNHFAWRVGTSHTVALPQRADLAFVARLLSQSKRAVTAMPQIHGRASAAHVATFFLIALCM
jgi:hypothetical protein